LKVSGVEYLECISGDTPVTDISVMTTLGWLYFTFTKNSRIGIEVANIVTATMNTGNRP